MSAARWETESFQAIVEESLARVSKALGEFAEREKVAAKDPLRQAYELRWQDKITSETYASVNSLFQSGRLILGMSRAPKSSITSRFVDFAREIEGNIRASAHQE
jgi:hypothetical protein